MNLNRYTEKAQQAILAAQQTAERSGHPEILPEHLLSALLTQPEGIVPALLGKMQVNTQAIVGGADALLKALPRTQGGAQPGASSRLRAVLSAAEQEAEALKDEYTST
jgi:ATP-dependent Clp protease ATP-binding subunit ClpB